MQSGLKKIPLQVGYPKKFHYRWVPLLLMLAPGIGLAQSHLEPVASPGDPLIETRICGAPERYSNGVIKRRAAVVNAYRRVHPCPVTGLHDGACPGWQLNHIIPLASGGCDSVVNLAWMPVQIKTCSEFWCVDRWERNFYRNPYGILPTW